jgi:GNAT superfamily N-acetyltransferase
MTAEVAPVPLAAAQVKEASEVVARAFHDDPLAVWLLPDESKRAEVQTWMTAATLRYALNHGEIYTTAGEVQGAAIWIPPEKYPMSLFRLLLAGWILAPLRMGMTNFRRFMEVANHYERLHRRGVPLRHWYLMTLGVDPPRQGQGIGGALIRPVLARADAEGVPCYLETEKERNLPFYGRHGFEVVVEGGLRNGGPRFWTMKREPIG